MLDVWRGTLSPRTLLNLIDHLPRNSHFAEATAQDDELAEGLLDRPEGGRPAAPPMTEFSPEAEVLAAVVDRLGELIRTYAAANGGNPPPLKLWPRPVTAADRAHARARKAAMDDLQKTLFPDSV